MRRKEGVTGRGREEMTGGGRERGEGIQEG